MSTNDRTIIWKKSTNQKKKDNFPGHKTYQKMVSDDPDAPSTLGALSGHQILQARNNKGLTQAELARKINVQYNIIRDYECGNAIPNREIIKKLNRELGIKITL